MPKNYKTYAKPGSFSEFQIKTPDQTGKIKEEKQREVQGRERAQRSLERNRDIYMRAQRLVNAAEAENRQTNFDMQTVERESYRNALTRDYKIQMDNLDRQNQGRQRELQEISQLSQTAFGMIGNYLEEQEQKKVAIAHDVIARSGSTYEELIKIQTLNDNLTKAEFAAQDSVQQMLGPNAAPDQVDALFTIYQNRNTKRWIEHKAFFANSLNAFPSFLDAKINEIREATGQPIDDFDSVIDEAKREFIGIHFVGTARPEVLSGLGVYSDLDKLANQRRDVFVTERRKLQKEEFARDRQNAFLTTWQTEGLQGVLRYNGQNPSYQKRQDMVAAIKLAVEGGGTYTWGVQDIEDLLNAPGGGSNGKSIRESFAGTTAELEEIQRDILKREAEASKAEAAREQREMEAFVIDRANELGMDDGVLSEADVDRLQIELHRAYPGMTSTEFAKVKMMTPDAAVALETEQFNERMSQAGRLTMEHVNNGKYNDINRRLFWEGVARTQEKLYAHEGSKNDLLALQNEFDSSAAVRGARAANPKANEINYALAMADYKARYRTYTQKFMAADKEMTFDKARKQAYDLVLFEMKEDLNPDNHSPFGGIKRFRRKPIDADQAGKFRGIATTGEENMKKIISIAQNGDLTNDAAAQQAAALMNHKEIEMFAQNYTNPDYAVPPAVIVYADAINRTPITALGMLAPHIGDGNLKLVMDKVDKDLKTKYQQYVDTPYTYIRNKYRTAERTGRANIGDNKSAATAPMRTSMFKVVQYVSGDPAIRGKSTADGRIVYDNGDGPRGHGGRNYHNHYEFETPQQAAAAKLAFEQAGFRVTSYLRPNDTGSAHSRGVAIDVAPPTTLPYTDEAEAAWSAAANAIIGFTPFEDE